MGKVRISRTDDTDLLQVTAHHPADPYGRVVFVTDSEEIQSVIDSISDNESVWIIQGEATQTSELLKGMIPKVKLEVR